ncbi:MAG TPA: hypothetical protein VNE83_04805 [Terriglobales bacterium]|nr:hypothetical protein [Terriglobales bacterium]
MAARGDPLAAHRAAPLLGAHRAPVQPGAEPRGDTLPELDRRLLMQRSAVVESFERLRGRVRQDLRNLNPLEQAQRRPEATLAIAAGVGLLTGLVLGRIVGGLAARLFGSHTR